MEKRVYTVVLTPEQHDAVCQRLGSADLTDALEELAYTYRLRRRGRRSGNCKMCGARRKTLSAVLGMTCRHCAKRMSAAVHELIRIGNVRVPKRFTLTATADMLFDIEKRHSPFTAQHVADYTGKTVTAADALIRTLCKVNRAAPIAGSFPKAYSLTLAERVDAGKRRSEWMARLTDPVT